MARNQRWAQIAKAIRFLIEAYQAIQQLKEKPAAPKQVPAKQIPPQN